MQISRCQLNNHHPLRTLHRPVCQRGFPVLNNFQNFIVWQINVQRTLVKPKEHITRHTRILFFLLSIAQSYSSVWTLNVLDVNSIDEAIFVMLSQNDNLKQHFWSANIYHPELLCSPEMLVRRRRLLFSSLTFMFVHFKFLVSHVLY